MILDQPGKIADRLYILGHMGLPVFLYDDRFPVLFDAGMTFMGPRYLKELQIHLGNTGHLSYLFLTHSHFDHCGAAPFLQRKIPGLKVGAHPLAAEVFRKPGAVRLIRSLSQEAERKFPPPGGEDVSFRPPEVDLPLRGEEVIDLGEDQLRVIATPGHTRDGLSFYLPQAKTLVPGEVMGYYGRKRIFQPVFLTGYQDTCASLKKLQALEVDFLLLGHYYMLSGREARRFMDKALEPNQRFRERIERELGKARGSQEEVVRRIFEEDYDPACTPHGEKPYLLNLAAMVKTVALGK